MAQWKALGGMTLVASFLGGTALADVTAEDVWTDWVGYYEDIGQSVTAASQEKSGDTLTLTDAIFSADLPDGNYSLTIPEVRLREMGDGRVEVMVSEEMPMEFSSNVEGGEAVDMNMVLRHANMVTIVSGNPNDTAYEVTADELGAVIDGMVVEGEDLAMNMAFVMNDVVSNYSMTTADGRIVTSDLNASGLTFDVSMEDPNGDGNFTMNGNMGAITGTSAMTVPGGVDMNDLPAALKAGMSIAADLSYGAGEYAIDFQDGRDTMQASANAGGGTFKIEMSSDGLSYETAGNGADISIAGSAAPFPIEISLASSAFNFAMPIAASDDAKPFGMLLKVVELKVSDQIWGLFDPTEQLPRDPATVIIDMSGEAVLTADIMDPEVADNLSGPPGQLNAINLNELKVTAVGVDLSGEGGFTFDNSDMSMGFPKPLGAVDLALEGGNALMDKLVAMGLLPEDQAMGARMMMGLFAVPDGDDRLTTKIEFREDGGLYANGQRLQ